MSATVRQSRQVIFQTTDTVSYAMPLSVAEKYFGVTESWATLSGTGDHMVDVKKFNVPVDYLRMIDGREFTEVVKDLFGRWIDPLIPLKIIRFFDYLELREPLWQLVDIYATYYLLVNFPARKILDLKEYRELTERRRMTKSRAKPLLFPRVSAKIAQDYFDFLSNMPALGLDTLKNLSKHSLVLGTISDLPRATSSEMPLTDDETKELTRLLGKLGRGLR